MTTILAGFGTFPGVSSNPTQRLVEAQAFDGIPNLHRICLPVEWALSWRRLRTAIEVERPRRVLMTGVAVRAERPRLELAGRRRDAGSRPDAAGQVAAADPMGPNLVSARFPRQLFADALREAGLAFEWSTDAGDYLCNDVLYRLGVEADALGVAEFAFLHVPLTDECVPEDAAGWPGTTFRSVPSARLEAAVGLILRRWPEGGSR